MGMTFRDGYSRAYVVTPHDTNEQPGEALYIGSAGNVTVKLKTGETVLFTAPPIGTIIPIKFTHVMATGTTVTTMTALA